MRKSESNLEFPLSLLFLFDFRFSETERKDPKQALEFSCILKENSSHGFAVVSFHCLTLSLPMNKVSLKGACAPSPAAMSHCIRTVQQTPPANVAVPTASVLPNFTLHIIRGFSQWKR